MRTAVLCNIRDIRLQKVRKPIVSGGEVLIRVAAAGVCGTDIHFYRGEWNVAMPLILGHEFSGTVAELEEQVEGFEVGDQVVAEPNMVCGSCHFCRMSDRNFFCEG